MARVAASLAAKVLMPAPSSPNSGAPQCPKINSQLPKMFSTFAARMIHIGMEVLVTALAVCWQALKKGAGIIDAITIR